MGDRAEDGPGPVLVGTKLRPPAVRDQVVPRERLLEPLRTELMWREAQRERERSR